MGHSAEFVRDEGLTLIIEGNEDREVGEFGQLCLKENSGS